ncbi:bacilysin biosynthesis protein BacA [Dickeya dadantii]|uniref:bacilysin biosynthesis protein BacA n=1 Tax=Dickeya dadantii TaxID=204038 RepID=UPI000576BE43|nr:bacilysin biosynthesis protein BacA [Dickeya dadantii]MCA7014583.1 bacilysin biosynthesis protein BacA [Dickeya dadantii]NAT78109.1 bacilysin biosynthesis protein BacA [Dickeya dadantii]NPE52056.1 bacilysin biosynthesis protein BacA [Dickeya dadantii]NPE55658.1 bacilysin biosynthesis protein BacA [Dickeya dadantii]NPE60401.1 bacilysin biosynthesis protein BacA [Dickeya dadantii]
MNMHFMDMGLHRVINLPVFTLGPAGTSSESASRYFGHWMESKYEGSTHQVYLNDTYEEAREQLNQSNGLLIVANAYPQINDFYMDLRLKLTGTFVFDTPLYGLAIKETLPNRPVIVASHPAPVPLIQELLPDGLSVERVVTMSSTSAAAQAVANHEVDMALTTEVAVNLHRLRFISRTRPIHMLWSIFSTSH